MMHAGLSAYLHLLRFGAAMVVVMSHFAYPRFTEGRWLWLRELNLGSDAVVVFFVLSGLLIAMSAAEKDADLRAFLGNRAVRLLSVALPALVLGFALDRLGMALDPALYQPPYMQLIPFWEQMLRGLSFSNEWSLGPVRLGSNGPYWSLSYEAAYYLAFGVAVYLSGARRWALLLCLALLAGWNVLLLAPSWMMGVALYRAMARGALPRGRRARVWALLPVAFYGVALWVDLPLRLQLAQPHFAGLRFSDEYLWNALLGLGVAMHLAGMAGLTRPDGALARRRAALAWLAGAGFSLYLVHYPLLQFTAAVLPDLPARLNDAVLLGLVVTGCYIFAAAFERPIVLWRALCGAVLRRGTTGAAPPQRA